MDTEHAQDTQLYALSNNEKKDGAWVGQPCYSQDGQHIVFVKAEKVDGTLYRHLYSLDPESGSLTQLTGGELDTTSPACGAGNEIFFVVKTTKPEKTCNIYAALVDY
jgi:Tol biopolymer transport system component